MPKISVIVPVYNVGAYVDKCVLSLLEQTYTDFELILVNDGSTDNSGELCDNWKSKDDRIKVVHKQNGGLSDARNAGIEVACGEYYTFIDSDDYVENNYLEVLYNAILKSDADISISSHKAVYSNGTVLDKQTGEESVLTPKETLRRILYDDGIDLSAWAKLYKAELFETIRFPFGRVFEDAATTYLLVDKAQKIAVCSVATYNYMIRDNSITGTSFSPKKMHLITSTQEMCDYVRAKYPDLEKPCDRRLMYAYLSTLSQLAMSKQKFPEEQKILMDYVTKNGNAILKDEKAEKRDKLGIIAAKFGFTSFKLLWNFYRKISGRK